MKCRGKAVILTGLIGLIVLILSLKFWELCITGAKEAREAHIISLHFLAWSQESEFKDSSDRPKNINELLEMFGPSDASMLLNPFPNGLTYQVTDTGFRLEEPKPSRVSLLWSDRLVSTESKWPRWEKSGEIAKKGGIDRIPEGFE